MLLQKVVDFLKKLNRPLVVFIKYVAIWILSMMMFLTFTDVFLRKFFNSPISGGAELIEFMMGIFVTFSVAYTAHKKAHIGVDLVITHFQEKTRKLISSITSFLTLIFFIFIAWQSFIYIADEYHSNLTSAVLYIPVYPFVAIVAVGFSILCLVLLAEFLSTLGEVLSQWTRS